MAMSVYALSLVIRNKMYVMLCIFET